MLPNPRMLSLYQYEHLPFAKRRIAARFFEEAIHAFAQYCGERLNQELEAIIKRRDEAIGC